jgi:hypothetical protein
MSSGAELTPTGALSRLWAPAQRRVQLRIDERAPVRRVMIENALHGLEDFHRTGCAWTRRPAGAFTYSFDRRLVEILQGLRPFSQRPSRRR